MVCTYYDLAMEFSNPGQLTKKFDEIISTNTFAVFQKNSFKKCSRTVFKKILGLNYLVCSESSVFGGAVAWATEACRSKELPATTANLKNELGECLSLIRFPILTKEEFSQRLVQYSELFEHDIFFDIMNYIYEKRPLTCARYYNNNPRSKSVSFWPTNVIIKKTDPLVKADSNIFFTTNKAILLYYCDIIILKGMEDHVKIRFNGACNYINSFTETLPLKRDSSSTLESFGVYRLKFYEPFLCETGKEHSLLFSFNDQRLNEYVALGIGPYYDHTVSMSTGNDVNYIVKEIHYKFKA